MCLILFAHDRHPDYAFVVAANRDEFHARPSLPLADWDDKPGIVGGRDLEAGGTWLAMSRRGGFAAVTNVRGHPAPSSDAPSRGELIPAFLAHDNPPLQYCQGLESQAARYAGFNLLLWQAGSCVWKANAAGPAKGLSPGCYGVSNALLDTAWPKLNYGRDQLQDWAQRRATDTEDLFELLATGDIEAVTPQAASPGIPTRVESSLFLLSGAYGTRASTVVLVDRCGSVSIEERLFDNVGSEVGRRQMDFQIQDFCTASPV